MVIVSPEHRSAPCALLRIHWWPFSVVTPRSSQPLLSAHAEFGLQNLQLAPPLLYLARRLESTSAETGALSALFLAESVSGTAPGTQKDRLVPGDRHLSRGGDC